MKILKKVSLIEKISVIVLLILVFYLELISLGTNYNDSFEYNYYPFIEERFNLVNGIDKDKDSKTSTTFYSISEVIDFNSKHRIEEKRNLLEPNYNLFVCIIKSIEVDNFDDYILILEDPYDKKSIKATIVNPELEIYKKDKLYSKLVSTRDKFKDLKPCEINKPKRVNIDAIVLGQLYFNYRNNNKIEINPIINIELSDRDRNRLNKQNKQNNIKTKGDLLMVNTKLVEDVYRQPCFEGFEKYVEYADQIGKAYKILEDCTGFFSNIFLTDITVWFNVYKSIKEKLQAKVSSTGLTIDFSSAIFFISLANLMSRYDLKILGFNYHIFNIKDNKSINDNFEFEMLTFDKDISPAIDSDLVYPLNLIYKEPNKDIEYQMPIFIKDAILTILEHELLEGESFCFIG